MPRLGSEQRKLTAETLGSFVAYCHEHPDLRFWQALSGWAGYHVIVVSLNNSPCEVIQALHKRVVMAFDTFNFRGRIQ